ncbi:MAG: hypothetical protein JWL97_4096 [Gemmatimonadales bacterium]|nr:hypothetical protein [Gemmatimonadales bacterium]
MALTALLVAAVAVMICFPRRFCRARYYERPVSPRNQESRRAYARPMA